MNKQARLLSALAALCVFFAFQQRVQAQTEEVPRFEVGVQFSSLTISEPSNHTEPGVGGRLTFNVNQYFAVEAQVDFYPSDDHRFGGLSGGRATTGFFGVKTGKRFEKFGVFAKARPGFVRFGRTFAGFSDIGPSPPDFPFFVPQFRSRTEFATDIGGVLEFYPTRRIVTRFDFGDTLIHYGERTTNARVFTPTGDVTLVPFTSPSVTRHNFQFSAGIGFRF
ncbi:MAG: outer membrane beta-barrel protein [Pyrinomonadaceae bacterium]